MACVDLRITGNSTWSIRTGNSRPRESMASECSEENAPVHEAGTIEWSNSTQWKKQ
jgi:hypothetical protein